MRKSFRTPQEMGWNLLKKPKVGGVAALLLIVMDCYRFLLIIDHRSLLTLVAGGCVLSAAWSFLVDH